MKFDSKSPLIGIPVCVREQEGHPFHSVGEKYITGVALGAGGLPLLIPALGDAFDHRDLVRDRRKAAHEPVHRRFAVIGARQKSRNFIALAHDKTPAASLDQRRVSEQ